MSSPISALPTPISPPAPAPAKSAVKPPAAAPPVARADTKASEKKAADTPPHPSPHRAASALSPRDIGYVKSLMGVAPAQAMASIMLKTGVPMPANLGQDIDTTA